MAKFRCLNCKRDWQRDVLTPERLKDLDMRTCPFCRSFWTELVPDAEIKLNGLKISKELLESFKANVVSGFLRKKAIDESLALGAKIGNPPPTKNNFIIWLLTRDGVEIRQKYANTRFRPEQYLWADYVWNPIKGLCPVGCWYCYARRMYQRFKKNPIISCDLIGDRPELYSEPSRVFVCSTFELFHPVADQWRDDIFAHIIGSQHTFIILTKMPERIDRPMPDNVWLGVSITGEKETHDCDVGLYKAQAKIKFVSFEPLLAPAYLPKKINWAIIGRLTGHGHKYDPSLALLEIITHTYQCREIPIFLKNNLKDIWRRPLIQEFPQAQPAPAAKEE